MRMLRVVPILALVASGCIPGQRATLRPGSDMALPDAPAISVEKRNGKTCGTLNVGKAGVGIGPPIECSPLGPDSTQRPTKPPGTR